MAGDSSGDRDIRVGVVVAPQGVRGEVRIKAFTEDPMAVGDYGPLHDGRGRRWSVKALGLHKGTVRARLDGVEDRNGAEALRGTELYADRDALPALEEDAFYYADLVGLAAVDTAGAAVGTVVAVFDFGAGDVVEITQADGSPLMLPFTDDAVPEVDLDGGRMVVDPPPGLMPGGGDEPGEPGA